MMKNTIKLMLMAIAMVAMFTACNDDDDIIPEKETTTETVTEVTQTPKPLTVSVLNEQLSMENPGYIVATVTYNNKVYIKMMPNFKKGDDVWYEYKAGKSLTATTPPNQVVIEANTFFNDGVTYQGKYYFAIENRTDNAIYTYDKSAGTATRVAMDYPEGFNAIKHLTVFNDKLYFAANSKAYGKELFSYTPTEGIKLLPQVAPGYLDSGHRFPISSNPAGLFVWNDYLVFAAQDDKRPDSGTYGRELYKLDKAGNVSILKDFAEGNKGSEFSMQAFLSKQTGQTVIYNYTDRKFYVLNNDFSITAFSYGNVANNLYEIKGQVSNDNYLVLAARTDFNHVSVTEQTRVHPVIIEKNGTTHLFKDISSNPMTSSVFWKGYYIFNGQKTANIGYEPYAINLTTWEVSLLKDIRTKGWSGPYGGVDYGSDPSVFTALGDEVLFSADLDDKTDNFTTFIITETEE